MLPLPKAILCLFIIVACGVDCIKAQDNLYTSYTTAASRTKLYRNLLSVSINKNLSLPLNDSTEEKWQEAFWALELLQYTSAWLDDRITNAFDSISFRSNGFKAALMEVAFTNYPERFFPQVNHLLSTTTDPKVFALCAEYLLRQKQDYNIVQVIRKHIKENLTDSTQLHPCITVLQMRLTAFLQKPPGWLINNKNFTDLLNSKFLPGEIVMYSFQRKNRDYPGLVIIRKMDGSFVRDSTNTIFHIAQLARSITDLPFYISNGNTPQGIFLMKGFNVSRSNFIGPTANIQLSMPVEEKIKLFLNDSDEVDTTWRPDHYARLLPRKLADYEPLYESYYAGRAGRTEIIAHGTTINPDYYKGKPWYPHTPSQGCLSTMEIWNGKRVESNQQKLVYAMLAAGGAHGYCVVLEIDDKQAPVTFEELLPSLRKAESTE